MSRKIDTAIDTQPDAHIFIASSANRDRRLEDVRRIDDLRIAGPEATKFGWQSLNAKCAKQLNIEARRQGVDGKEPGL